MPGIVSFHGRGVGGPAVKVATEEYLLCAGFKESEGHFDRLGAVGLTAVCRVFGDSGGVAVGQRAASGVSRCGGSFARVASGGGFTA
jgi:hypothetical protein